MAIKTISFNRKAYHDYSISDSVEAGIVLTGNEIRSIRDGKVNIREAYAHPRDGELWLFNAHIAHYAKGNGHNQDSTRPRKLLLHRRQIDEIAVKVRQKGFTLAPLRLYIKNGVAKVELGLARGKKLHDKRETEKKRDWDRQKARLLRERG